MKIWLDDIRDAPDDSWTVARDVHEAADLIAANYGNIEVLSLDHDLGEKELLPDLMVPRQSGYDLLFALEEAAGRGDLPISDLPQRFEIHSANPVGRKNMQAAIDSIERMRHAS